MALATVASVVGIAGGVNALTGGAITNALGMGGGGAAGGSASGAGQAASGLADPFAASRGMYGQQLNQLMKGGPDTMKTLENQPGYQFQLDQGLNGLKRGDAAAGTYGGGGMSADLIKYSQGLASTNYNNYFNQLSELSGAGWGSSAGANAGNAIMGGQNTGFNQGMSGLGTAMSGLASLGQQLNQPTPTNQYSGTWNYSGGESLPT